MNGVDITTALGSTKLFPVYCEVTGNQLCWRTNPAYAPDVTPAYVGFDVVNPDGEILQPELLLGMLTF